MTETMQLVVGWTIVGAFVFTVTMTCGSMVGWVRFADRNQQRKLFSAVIVEIVLAVGTSATNVARFDPSAVRNDLLDKGNNKAILDLLDDGTKAQPGSQPKLTKGAGRIVGRDVEDHGQPRPRPSAPGPQAEDRRPAGWQTNHRGSQQVAAAAPALSGSRPPD